MHGTGVLELLGALGLVLARARPAAGWCLAALFVCLLPANVHAARAFRIPEQLTYVAVAVTASRSHARRPLR
ncbi:hypothetical protein [Streptomyces sp. NPDC005209]|uniref:hypothetical protein n=1 Tax=Streptomyces sp. NPDC005209 TaxID=3156715 RepID=UPI0033BBF978